MESMHVRRWVAGAALAAAAWAALMLAAAVAWVGESAGAALARPEPWVATALAFAASHALRFARWHWMLRAEGYAVPVPRSLAVFMAGLALLPTPAKAGVAVRSLLLHRDGVPADVTIAMYFSERLSDFLGLVMLAALLVPQGGGRRWLAAFAAGLVVVVLVRAAPRLVAWIRGRVARPRAAAALAWTQRFADHGARLASDRRFWPWVLLGIAANAVTGALLWHLAAMFAAPLELGQATGVVATSHLAGSLSLMPGGLGGFELAMLAQLDLLGMAPAAALAALACVRVATIWGSVAVGLAALAACWRARGSR